MTTATRLHVLKGHGTENDFVVLPDPDGRLDPDGDLVRALCDRRAGLGGDGLLRVVPSAAVPDAPAGAAWFMDYRNADGSVAEMCGNGIRVVAAYLRRAGLVDGDRTGIGTRAGVLAVTYEPDGTVTVAMGRPRRSDAPVTVSVPGQPDRTGVQVGMPNPHVVVELPDRGVLDGLDLTVAPQVTPRSPAGQNVEFVVRRGEHHLAMRVHERGVGETRSCGTGICAAVVALAGQPDGDTTGAGPWWRVDVPGGTCHVRRTADGVDLRGPAVLLAEVDVDPQALARPTGPDAHS